MSRRILVTSALPYANGSIHIGHLVEYIYTDIWVRHLRMGGNQAIYLCADDTHGTPIELRARKEKISAETLIRRMHEEHARDFASFDVSFDLFYTTHSDENRQWAERIYQAAKSKGHIIRREVEQTYCDNDRLFLPDRYIRGTCPRCKAPDQYGDSCDSCSATYRPTDLVDPKCAICGRPPVRKKSEHLFFALSQFADRLASWTSEPGRLQAETQNYVKRWIEEGLLDWDITRDGPYFGFPIPGETDKYFYVWFDAPIGYISTTERYCKDNGLEFRDWWENPETEIVHFIGKDIVYFHTLFWPAMLMDAGLTAPRKVNVHGFLKVDGSKMSKSKGTFVTARTYLDHLDPQYLRYYYATKLSGNVEDIELNFEDFQNRVNAELVNKIANLASRSVSFVNQRLDRRLGVNDGDAGLLLDEAVSAVSEVRAAYDQGHLAKAVQKTCTIAESANLYLQGKAPWDVLKQDPERARGILTTAINLTKMVSIMLKPVLPRMASSVETMLEAGRPWAWKDAVPDLRDREIGPFVRLAERIEMKDVDAMVQASIGADDDTPGASGDRSGYSVPPLSPEIGIETFSGSDLRVAKVRKAAKVEGAKKLLSLELDLGPLGTRHVFAGIAEHFPDPEALTGRLLICVANLKPRSMKWGTSEGMILAASGTGNVTLLEVGSTARPGEKVG